MVDRQEVIGSLAENGIVVRWVDDDRGYLYRTREAADIDQTLREVLMVDVTTLPAVTLLRDRPGHIQVGPITYDLSRTPSVTDSALALLAVLRYSQSPDRVVHERVAELAEAIAGASGATPDTLAAVLDALGYRKETR